MPLFDWENESSYEPEFSKILEDYDNNRDQFFKFTKRYAIFPTDNNFTKVQTTKGCLIDNFHELLNYLYDDDTSNNSEQAAIIANFMYNEDQRRAEHFNSLLGLDNDYEIDDNDRQETIDGFDTIITADRDRSFQSIYDAHVARMNQDLNQFSEVIECSRQAKFIKVSKQIGKHALIVGDVVVGVYIYDQLIK